MFRKVATVAAAVLLGLTVVPALPASAAPSAATLIAGVDVLPGTARQFAIDVRNTDSSPLGGRRIDLVLFTLPSNIGIKTNMTAAISAPTGWDVVRTSAGSVQTYQFRTKTAQADEAIAPGASQRFTFPGDVSKPVSTDRKGTFKVTASDDYGQTVDAATGALDTTVRILEVVDGSLKGLTPSGVTDGSGTAGQAITYGVSIKNHAQQAVPVTPTLTSGNDTVQAPTPVAGTPVLGDATQEFSFPVTLGGVVNRTSSFSAGATAPSASALTKTAGFEVQAPADYAPIASSLTPKIVRKNRSYTFSVEATKLNKPAFETLTGTFSFGKTTTELLTRAPARNTDGTVKPGVDLLTYKSTTVNPEDVDGRYNVTLTFDGTDDNGYAFPTITKSLTNGITVDTKLPLPTVNIELPSDTTDGKRQSAVKNGDRVNVSGVLDEGATDCTSITLQSVTATTDKGKTLPVTVTRNGCSYTGSLTTTPEFTAGGSSFTVRTDVLDGAENPGFATTVDTAIDTAAPVFDYAKSLSSRQILVEFDENLGLVRGGCAPQQWEVDGEPIITSVLYSNGSPCRYTPGTVSAAGTDNTRILVLSRDRDQDFQANVQYRPGTFPTADPVKDGANAAAGANKVLSDIGINPTAPTILAVTRNNGTETATFDSDEGRYFTRFSKVPGPDGTPVDDLRVSFANGRAGYKVRVLDGNNNMLSEAPVGGSPATVQVPLGATDGVYERKLVLVNGANLVSVPTAFTVVLDTLAPTIQGATLRATGNQVDVTFAEKLATGGSESPLNWFGKAIDPQADPADPDQKNRVSPATKVEGSGASRLITLADNFNGLQFNGVEYILQSPDGKRYPDRAGNLLMDTTKPAV